MAKVQEDKKGQTAVSTHVTAQMPDFMRGRMGLPARGAENVQAEDLVIPRLEIVQSLSPARKENDPAYIPGAKEGMLYNNVTRELYGPEVSVIPVFFKKEWLLWKNRDTGGGFRGAFASAEAAAAAKDALEDGDDVEAVDTAQQFCLLVRPDGTAEEIAVSMSRSKMKVSRKWNSLIRLGGGDSFSRVYRVKAVPEKNSKNQDFWNLGVEVVGWSDAQLYERAEKLYEQVSKGLVSVSRAADETESGDTRGNEY